MTHFRIGDLTFHVSSALLVPFFDIGDDEGDFLVFGVEIQGTSSDVYWSARLACDELVRQPPGVVRSFRDLYGRGGGWRDGEDDEGEPGGLLTTLGHEPVFDVQWGFSPGARGELDFSFSGTSIFAHGDGMDGPLRIDIACPLAYEEILCARRSESECRELLKRFGLQDNFRYSRNEHGVSQLIPVDYPGTTPSGVSPE